jgi:hypothetical protein
LSEPHPFGFAIGPPFWARLALALPDPIDQLEWSRQGHDNEVGADFVANWAELFEVPGRDPARWRRSVFPARAPFPEPGWVMYDARLLDDDIAELRRVELIATGAPR